MSNSIAYGLANSAYQALSAGDGDVESVRKVLYEIMLQTLPDGSELPPFTPFDEGQAPDPIAAIASKVAMSASSSVPPQFIGSPVAAILGDAATLTPVPVDLSRWTTATLRAELGKHGFLVDSNDPNLWTRLGFKVRVIIPTEAPPFLINEQSQIIDISELSHRNVNMRQSTEGNAT